MKIWQSIFLCPQQRSVWIGRRWGFRKCANGWNSSFSDILPSTLKVLDLDVGVKGVGLFRTTSEMADSTGAVAGDKLYGAASNFAEKLAGVPFAPTQVGNIKYKVPVKPNTVLAVKGRIVLMRGKKKYIYIGFFDGDIEVYRAKFIMEILN